MFTEIEAILISYIEILPLEIFVFIASFIEEVIAPVPSSAVLLLSGSFAAVQERTLLELIPLILIAALGKTIGAIMVYHLSDKIGGAVITRFGKFFGVTHEAITDFGQKITGSPKDYLLLITFRALPVIPSSVVSIGYRGTQVLSDFATHSTNIESIVQTIFLAALTASLAYFYFKRKQEK